MSPFPESLDPECDPAAWNRLNLLADEYRLERDEFQALYAEMTDNFNGRREEILQVRAELRAFAQTTYNFLRNVAIEGGIFVGTPYVDDAAALLTRCNDVIYRNGVR